MAWSWSNALKQGGIGAAGGALTGLPGGLLGSGLGAGLGGLAGLISGGFSGDGSQSSQKSGQMGDDFNFQKWLFDSPEGQQALSRFSPEQQQALSQSLKSGRNRIDNPSQGFEPIRENAIQDWEQRAIPSIMHRLSVGGDNALSSPVLHSQLAGSRANLSSDLSALEAQFGQRNQQLGLDELRLGLSPQYDQGVMQNGQTNYKKILDVLQDQFHTYLQGRNKPTQAASQSGISPQISQPGKQKQYFGISPKGKGKQYFGITNPRGM